MVILRESFVKKTHRPHQCFGCLKTIPTGSPAHVQVNTDVGVGSIYTHPACEEIMQKMYDDMLQGETLSEGCVLDELSSLGFEGTPEEYVKAMPILTTYEKEVNAGVREP